MLARVTRRTDVPVRLDPDDRLVVDDETKEVRLVRTLPLSPEDVMHLTKTGAAVPVPDMTAAQPSTP